MYNELEYLRKSKDEAEYKIIEIINMRQIRKVKITNETIEWLYNQSLSKINAVYYKELAEMKKFKDEISLKEKNKQITIDDLEDEEELLEIARNQIKFDDAYDAYGRPIPDVKRMELREKTLIREKKYE